MKFRYIKYLVLSLGFIASAAVMTGCSDDKSENINETKGVLNIPEQNKTITVDSEETFASTSFTSTAAWTAELENSADAKWLTLLTPKGVGGTNQALKFDLKRNTTKEVRTATIVVKALGDTEKVTVSQLGSTLDVMSEDDVKDFAKYYKPQEFRGMDMFRSDSKWSWFRHKQSEHFFVFWEPGFGDDPNGANVPDWARVDVDDLLQKAEQFFKTNINTLGMAVLGQGKSNLDKYKMEIYLLYQQEWLATGSGYDDVIGALWVNPSTCKPVGSTIAHEIGHSFQYQVYADKVANDLAANYNAGFRYGWGGTGGCTYWEQCAQWQSMYDYPYEKFGQDFNPWLVNYHRHFCHEWMRYQSYWLQNYWVQLHGIDAFGTIWRESKAPEDPIQTYVRVYCGGNYQKFWDEYYDYAARMVSYDMDNVRQYKDTYWSQSSNYKTSLFGIGEYEYQISYASVPETAGFNIIRLNVPAGGGNVSVDLKALKVGSALAADDPGSYKKGDNEAVSGNVNHYNLNTTNKSNPDFRFGFVSIDNAGKASYSEMAHGAQATATYTVPSNATDLYLVVVPTPEQYGTHAWDNDDLTDEQWPYSFTVHGTDLFGNMAIDPDQEPKNIDFSYDFKCDATHADYVIGSLNFSSTGDLAKLAQAFVMQPASIAAVTVAPVNGTKGVPTEGNIVFGLLQPDGTIGYDYTANSGFYITADGKVGSWGANDPIWVEYDKENFVLTYGHKPGCPEAGKKYTVKPCLVYTKGGKQYIATFNINMQY